jgi:GABA permease
VTATLEQRTVPEAAAVSQRRILVVVDAACTAPDLCVRIRAHTGNDEIATLVIAPAHDSSATRWYVDEDAARAEATHRLRACVACLAQDRFRVQARLADPDPVQAIADALHDFAADEILIVTTPQPASSWLRTNLIDRARRTFEQPIEHVVMPTTTARRGR